MKITRVLNTNTVLSADANGDEVVLLGAGLGYKRRPGDEVENGRIEKQFVLKDKKNQSIFEKLVNNIPQEYILLAEQIISLAKALHELQLNESIHVSLADHIHSAVENFRDGITIPNTLTLDIKQFYPGEFDAALQGLALIKEKFGCELPLDEAGFIAMHFVNAEYGDGDSNTRKLIQLVKEMDEMILENLGITPDTNSLSYYRYMTHLKFFAQRILKNYHFKNEDLGILENVLLRYRKEYACSKKVAKYIQQQYGYKSGRDEVLYLTVHLAHLAQV